VQQIEAVRDSIVKPNYHAIHIFALDAIVSNDEGHGVGSGGHGQNARRVIPELHGVKVGLELSAAVEGTIRYAVGPPLPELLPLRQWRFRWRIVSRCLLTSAQIVYQDKYADEKHPNRHYCEAPADIIAADQQSQRQQKPEVSHPARRDAGPDHNG
jgi:hypothetical protein